MFNDINAAEMVSDSTELALMGGTQEQEAGTAVPMTDSEALSVPLSEYRALVEVGQELEVDSFNKTRDIITGHVDRWLRSGAVPSFKSDDDARKQCRAEAERFCEETETAWILANVAADKQEWTKGNKNNPSRLKLSKHLPNPYQSAKSVILNSISEGVEMVDADGKPLGKTALQKALKEPKSAEDKVKTMLESMLKLIPQCSDPEGTAAYLIVTFNKVWLDYEASRKAQEEAAGNGDGI